MSNPQLNRLLRGNGLTSFHVGAGSVARHATRPIPAVRLEHFTFSADTKKEYDFSEKKNREEGRKRKKGDDDSGSDLGSDDDGPHYNHDGIHPRGSDADGDGKTGEGKGPKNFKKDDNKNGKPDFMEKKKG